MSTTGSRTATLRSLLKADGIIVAPGAFNAFSAKIIEQAGFPVVYLTGYGASANLLGAPDFGLLTLTEMADHAARMAQAVGVPVVADGDTGYGNAVNVRRTIAEYERAGVAAIQLEDQLHPKRCGHMEGKEIIPAGEMVQKLRAAVDARKDPDFVIIARTDARALVGMDEAIRRARMYLDAGADVIFVESPQSREELAKVAKEIKAPLLANMIEHGKTPLLSAAELQDLGYKLVIFPLATLYMAAKAVQDCARVLKQTGTTGSLIPRMLPFHQFNEMVGLPLYRQIEDKYRS
ncbi:MAG TPA: carboxyvinyl-carboxyphosphonate phosphorylmutase [Clostridiales bacterium UBA8153]|nr:carboxyvinyl-carboxyphosphonate phosphorylmutase [Clostridiales bacterium UBA8153]